MCQRISFDHVPHPHDPPPGVPKLHVTYGGKELEHLRKDLRVVDYKRFSVLPVAQGRQYKTFERVEFGVRSVQRTVVVGGVRSVQRTVVVGGGAQTDWALMWYLTKATDVVAIFRIVAVASGVVRLW